LFNHTLIENNVEQKSSENCSYHQCNVIDGKRGVGLARSNGFNNGIWTVSHVVNNAGPASFGGKKLEIFGVTRFEDKLSIDPVIKCSVEKNDGVDLTDLTINEYDGVKMQMIVHPDGNVVTINDFKIYQDHVSGTVDLKSGDSGSPMLAVLNDGKIRYAGAVSRGSFDEGQGNLISLVKPGGFRGSPGIEGRQIGIPDHLNSVFDKNVELIIDKLKLLAVKKQGDSKSSTERRREFKKRTADEIERLVETLNLSAEIRTEIADAVDKEDIVAFNKIRGRFRPSFDY